MKRTVKDKVVLITGASAGIGRAAAIELGKAGAKVAMAARNKDKLVANTIKIKNSLAIQTDITDESQVAGMIASTIRAFGRIDVLINNAAMIVMSRSDSLKPDILRKAFETNLIGAVNATNYALPHMREKGGGHIINIGSPGFLIGLPFLGPYAISKGAMLAWTRGIQAEWSGSGIFVTEYLPGYIKTETIADSEFGRLGQDVFDDPSQNFILRKLAAAKSPEKVGRDLVRCVEKPKRVMYSGFNVRLGIWLAQMSSFRRSTGSKMAGTFCKRLNIKAFKD